MDAHARCLDLFTRIPVNTGVVSTEFIQVLPINQISDSIEFSFSSPNFLDLSRSQLMIKLKVTQDDGSNIDQILSTTTYRETGDVGPVNNFLYSIFSKQEFYLQHHNLSGDIQCHTYPFKSMIDLLTLSKEKDIPGQMFYKDKSEIMNSCSLWKETDDNKDTQKMDEVAFDSFKIRSKCIAKSREVLLIGPLGVDFATQPRLLLNNVNAGLKFWQNTNGFSLLSGADSPKFKVKVTEARLNLCHVTLTPELTLAINDSLKLAPCLYPYDKSIVKSYTITKGTQTLTIPDVFTHTCPNRIYVVMVNSTNFIGDYHSNPFFFRHMNVSEIGFYVNNRSLPTAPIKMNFTDSEYTSNFIEMFQNLKLMHPDCLITYDEFFRGYTIFCFDLSTSHTEGLSTQTIVGQTKLEMRFSKPLADSTTVIIYGKVKTCLSINQDRLLEIS
jgi:hypothetical protein